MSSARERLQGDVYLGHAVEREAEFHALHAEAGDVISVACRESETRVSLTGLTTDLGAGASGVGVGVGEESASGSGWVGCVGVGASV